MSSPADVIRRWEAKQARKNVKPDTVPTIRFDIPPLTTQDIVDNVFHNKGGWTSLAQAAAETAEGIRQRRISEKYDMTPIPRPEFEEDL